jgi:hypothetical protein
LSISKSVLGVIFKYINPKLSDSFKIVIASSGATKQSQSLKERFLTEFILSNKIRFLTAFGMTGEGFGMTVFKGLCIKTAQFR